MLEQGQPDPSQKKNSVSWTQVQEAVRKLTSLQDREGALEFGNPDLTEPIATLHSYFTGWFNEPDSRGFLCNNSTVHQKLDRWRDELETVVSGLMEYQTGVVKPPTGNRAAASCMGIVSTFVRSFEECYPCR